MIKTLINAGYGYGGVLTIDYNFNAKARKEILNVSQAAMDYLLGYHWPGNVIQLENVIERAFALGVEMTINVADLPDEIKTFGEISKIS